jgi:hypothetical protein
MKPRQSRRTFSKRMVLATFVLSWISVYAGIHYGTQDVSVAAITLIGAVASVYMGVGHMDFRALIRSSKPEGE